MLACIQRRVGRRAADHGKRNISKILIHQYIVIGELLKEFCRDHAERKWKLLDYDRVYIGVAKPR